MFLKLTNVLVDVGIGGTYKISDIFADISHDIRTVIDDKAQLFVLQVGYGS